jgi:cytidine deaminase
MPIAEAVLQQLVAAARAAAANAYAPASRFAVGAALLADDGSIHAGCNVENASYGLTMCAERNAVFHAVALGKRRFRAVVVHTACDPPGYPCGACLQVLAEFGSRMDVVLVNPAGKMVHTSLPALMPHPFRFDALG